MAQVLDKIPRVGGNTDIRPEGLVSTSIATSHRTKVFISFAHLDEDAAVSISDHLQESGIPVWIDRTGIEPGTPDWEQAIRIAMKESFAVVLLASPDSQASKYVRAELKLAKAQGIAIFPLWVRGDDWSSSVALELVYSQYIDGRFNTNYKERLVQTLLKHAEDTLPPLIDLPSIAAWRFEDKGASFESADLPPGYIGIVLPVPAQTNKDGTRLMQGVAIRVGSLQYVGDLLNELYLRYMRDKYRPFTYGLDWVLGQVEYHPWMRTARGESSLLNGEFLLPREYIHLGEQVIGEIMSDWMCSRTLISVNVWPGKYWRVCAPPTKNYLISIRCNRRGLIDMLYNVKARRFAMEVLKEVDLCDSEVSFVYEAVVDTRAFDVSFGAGFSQKLPAALREIDNPDEVRSNLGFWLRERYLNRRVSDDYEDCLFSTGKRMAKS